MMILEIIMQLVDGKYKGQTYFLNWGVLVRLTYELLIEQYRALSFLIAFSWVNKPPRVFLRPVMTAPRVFL